MSGERRTGLDHYLTVTYRKGTTHFVQVGEFELQLSLSAKGHNLRVFVDHEEWTA